MFPLKNIDKAQSLVFFTTPPWTCKSHDKQEEMVEQRVISSSALADLSHWKPYVLLLSLFSSDRASEMLRCSALDASVLQTRFKRTAKSGGTDKRGGDNHCCDHSDRILAATISFNNAVGGGQLKTKLNSHCKRTHTNTHTHTEKWRDSSSPWGNILIKACCQFSNIGWRLSRMYLGEQTLY